MYIFEQVVYIFVVYGPVCLQCNNTMYDSKSFKSFSGFLFTKYKRYSKLCPIERNRLKSEKSLQTSIKRRELLQRADDADRGRNNDAL